jgi:hypothetical protein
MMGMLILYIVIILGERKRADKRGRWQLGIVGVKIQCLEKRRFRWRERKRRNRGVEL